MATRKKTAKRLQENHCSQDHQEGRSKEGCCFHVKRIPGSATVRTKSQITNSIVDATGMTRKEVNTVFEALEALTVADLKRAPTSSSWA